MATKKLLSQKQVFHVIGGNGVIELPEGPEEGVTYATPKTITLIAEGEAIFRVKLSDADDVETNAPDEAVDDGSGSFPIAGGWVNRVTLPVGGSDFALSYAEDDADGLSGAGVLTYFFE